MPTLFIYFENDLKNQVIGPLAFNGMNLKQDDLEWKLHRMGVVKSNLQRNEKNDFEKDSRLEKCENDMIKIIRQGVRSNKDDQDEDDDY